MAYDVIQGPDEEGQRRPQFFLLISLRGTAQRSAELESMRRGQKHGFSTTYRASAVDGDSTVQCRRMVCVFVVCLFVFMSRTAFTLLLATLLFFRRLGVLVLTLLLTFWQPPLPWCSWCKCAIPLHVVKLVAMPSDEFDSRTHGQAIARAAAIESYACAQE